MRTRALLAWLATLLTTTAQAGVIAQRRPDLTLRLSGFALGYGAVDTSKTGWMGAGEFILETAGHCRESVGKPALARRFADLADSPDG